MIIYLNNIFINIIIIENLLIFFVYFIKKPFTSPCEETSYSLTQQNDKYETEMDLLEKEWCLSDSNRENEGMRRTVGNVGKETEGEREEYGWYSIQKKCAS